MADSIREALTSAISKAESTDTTDTEIEKVETTETSDSLAADDGTPDSTDTASSDAGSDDGDLQKAGSGQIAPEAAPSPAPSSWTAAERAEWNALSPAAKAAVSRREGEMQRAFQTSADARRRVAAYDKLGTDYKPLLERYGVSLEAALPPLLATRAALEVGTPQQKATLVANICADFGIDINDLDDALALRFQGGPPRPIQPPQPQADLRSNPALAPVFALADQITARQESLATEALAPIKAQPHYGEVRFTMADLIEKARDSGRSLDVNKAYGLACTIHGFDAPAGATGSVTTSQAAAILARSRKASTSVAGAPRPTPPRQPGEGSLRDELLANLTAARV